MENIIIPEPKKIPNFFYTVIADDSLAEEERAERAIREGFSSGQLVHGDIYLAGGVSELIQRAIRGNDGSQADVVLLDYSFLDNPEPWIPDYRELVKLAGEIDVDFSPYEGFTFLADGVHISILLRIFGYENIIFALTAELLDVNKLYSEVQKLAQHTSVYQPMIPLDGIINKRPTLGSMFFANKIINNEWEIQKADKNLSVALQELFSLK